MEDEAFLSEGSDKAQSTYRDIEHNFLNLILEVLKFYKRMNFNNRLKRAYRMAGKRMNRMVIDIFLTVSIVSIRYL